MTYQIEKNVPLPAAAGRRSKFPFDQMEIGDSSLVPLEIGKSPSSIFASVSSAKRRYNINLTTAREDGGIRIWRIALSQEQP